MQCLWVLIGLVWVLSIFSLGNGLVPSDIESRPESISTIHRVWLCIDGLVQDCSNSIANALELLQSCTKPSVLFMYYIWSKYYSDVTWASMRLSSLAIHHQLDEPTSSINFSSSGGPLTVFYCICIRTRFYPRPVLAIGYCRCLRLCVRVSVRVSVCVSISCLFAR